MSKHPRNTAATKQWVFTGNLSMYGATFFVSADSEDEAVAKARVGEFDEYYIDTADVSDWHLDIDTVRASE